MVKAWPWSYFDFFDQHHVAKSRTSNGITSVEQLCRDHLTSRWPPAHLFEQMELKIILGYSENEERDLKLMAPNNPYLLGQRSTRTEVAAAGSVPVGHADSNATVRTWPSNLCRVSCR